MPGQVPPTDEHLDRVWSRPAARVVVAAVHRTPITPNMLTGVATIFGVLVGVFLWRGEGLWAALMIAGYLAFDCSDGQLARKRGGGGVMGRIADGLGDYITAIAVHVGLIGWIAAQHGWLQGIALGAAAGASMAWTSLLFDRYKRRFAGSEDDVPALEAARDEATGLTRFLLASFLPYARRLNAGFAVPDLDAYRARVGGVFQAWLWVGPTTHFGALAVAAAFDEPRLYALVAVGPWNLLAALLRGWQRRLQRADPAVVHRV